MTFEERKALAIAIMDSKKMWKSNYAPPLLRGLWKLGVKIPPIPFIPSWKIFLFFGLTFGLIWGITMWNLNWQSTGTLPFDALIKSAKSGAIFGSFMATFHFLRKRVYKLPNWKKLDEHRDKNIIQ